MVLRSDSVAWALRREGDSVVTDLYHLRNGYRGSFWLVHRNLPAIVRDGLAWFALTDSLGISTFQAVEVTP